MFRRALQFTVGILTLASAAVGAPTSSLEVATVTIHPDRPLQVIEGFGASGSWWAQEVGRWPETSRREILQLLYDEKRGIGLTIYRHNIGAGSEADHTIQQPLRRAESHLRADGTLDWSRDAAAVRVLREAVVAGASKVVLVAFSPPVTMTKNGHAYGDALSNKTKATNLVPGRERDFARYLGAATEHFLCAEKLPVVELSPLNEPEWGWDSPKQEGCYYSPAEIVAVLKATAAELRARGLPVTLAGPESDSWKTARDYVRALAADAYLRAALPALSFHSYFSDAADKQATRAFLDRIWPEVRLHMSEWCELKTGRDLTMDAALVLARTVMEDLVIGRVTSWQYWLGATPHDYRDGLVQLEPAQRTGHATKRLWALGQFSRFLRPSARIVATDTSATAPRLVAARATSEVPTLVLVCINPESTAAKVRVVFSDGGKWRIASAHVTDSVRDLAPLAFTGDSEGLILPARSVTTFSLVNS
jgi:O-glycosyl hydrolase